MPQRFLRPGITESDPWNSCSFEAQSMYIRLLTLVDDYGRYDGRIAVLHAHCFALRPDIKPQRTATLRSELHANKLIRIYVVDRKEYVQILRWKEHARGTRSKYPSENGNPQESAADRSEAQESATSLVPRSSIIVPSINDQTIKRRTDKPSSVKDVIEFCEEEGLTEDDAKYFFNTKEGNGWRNGKRAVVDWKATIRSWAAAGHLPSTKGQNGSGSSLTRKERESKINSLNERKRDLIRQYGTFVGDNPELEEIEKQLRKL